MNESDLDDENPTWLKLTKVAGAFKSLEVDKNPPDFNNQTDGFKGKHTNRTEPKYKFPFCPKHTSNTVSTGLGNIQTSEKIVYLSTSYLYVL